MNILITGGSGFIGSYIARELIEGGHNVSIYDSFVQYVSPLTSNYQKYLEVRFANIKGRIDIIRGDTRDKVDVRSCIIRTKPDIIIHMAALPLADLSNTHTEEALSTIINGTVNILDILREVDFVKRFVYTSSSMIYGDFESEPASEGHPKRPKDVYGGAKLSGEVMTQSYGRRFGIEYSIVRPSAVYGPTDVNRRVSQIFLENAIAGKELVLYDSGKSRLDFTFVKDCAHGIILVALSKNSANEIFNITRGEGRSLKEYADILRQYFPDLRVKMEESSQIFRPKRGALDITKARTLLGYNPKYSLEDGIKEYIEFAKVNATNTLNTKDNK